MAQPVPGYLGYNVTDDRATVKLVEGTENLLIDNDLTDIEDELADHETRIDVLEAGGTGDPDAEYWKRPSTPHADDLEFTDGTIGSLVCRRTDTMATVASSGLVDYAGASITAGTYRLTPNHRNTFCAVQPSSGSPTYYLSRRISSRLSDFQIRARLSLPSIGFGASTAGISSLLISTEAAGIPSFTSFVQLGWAFNASNHVRIFAQRVDGGGVSFSEFSDPLKCGGLAGEFVLWISGAVVEFWFLGSGTSAEIAWNTFNVASVGSPLYVGWLFGGGTLATALRSPIYTCDYIRQQDDLILPW
jgi:hypothetical protein